MAELSSHSGFTFFVDFFAIGVSFHTAVAGRHRPTPQRQPMLLNLNLLQDLQCLAGVLKPSQLIHASLQRKQRIEIHTV